MSDVGRVWQGEVEGKGQSEAGRARVRQVEAG